MSRAASVVRMLSSSAAAGLAAGPGVPGRALLPDLQQLGRARHVLGPVGTEVVRVARQRRSARADAARVEADPVVGTADVPAPEALADDRAEDRQPEPGAARATGVEQHHALVLRGLDGVLDPRHRQPDLLASRVRVVQRHRDEPALAAEQSQDRVAAPAPVDGLGRLRSRLDSSRAARRDGDQPARGQAGRGDESWQLHGDPDRSRPRPGPEHNLPDRGTVVPRMRADRAEFFLRHDTFWT